MASFEREQDGAEGLDDHVRQAEEKNGNRDEHIRKMEADVERMKRELENRWDHLNTFSILTEP